MVAIGFAAVLTVQHAEIRADVAAADLAPVVYWSVVAGVLGVLVVLALAARAACELRHVVPSVDPGDPFIAENADRLRRMGWLVLWIQVVAVPIELGARRAPKLTDVGFSEFGASGAGFALVLTLFILARVFRLGSEMRADLEGTV